MEHLIGAFVSGNIVLAYIDPGTGSMVLQLILGGVAGLLIILKLWGQRIKSFLSFSKKDDNDNQLTS